MYRENGSGRRRRRSKMVLKRCGGIFVINVVGDTVNANPAPEPPWDRRIARSLDPTRSKRTSCLKWRSTLDAASCCHPPRAMPGSISSKIQYPGSHPFAESLPRWRGQNPLCRPVTPLPPINGVSGCPLQLWHDCQSDTTVARKHHCNLPNWPNRLKH